MPLMHCVTLEKSHNLPELQLPCLLTGDSNGIHLKSLRGLKEIMRVQWDNYQHLISLSWRVIPLHRWFNNLLAGKSTCSTKGIPAGRFFLWVVARRRRVTLGKPSSSPWGQPHCQTDPLPATRAQPEEKLPRKWSSKDVKAEQLGLTWDTLCSTSFIWGRKCWAREKAVAASTSALQS